jgi:RimJ/RimL family protein N-acetyltransferase
VIEVNLTRNIKFEDGITKVDSTAVQRSETLKDGTLVRIRQIQPNDKQGILLGMAHMSPQSRRNRFFSAINTLPDQILRDLTELDHDSHDAWVAVTGPTQFPHPVGVARYVRHPHDPHVAEIALAVVDEFQSIGMGTIFADILHEAARERGISEFSAIVLADNKKVLAMARKYGATGQFRSSGEYEIRAPVKRSSELH